jgi:putative endonuclease
MRLAVALRSRRRMTMRGQQLGFLGENLAVSELTRRGYAIVDRRYRTRRGEIDIVADDGGTIVFVEVKARATGDFGGGAEAVTPFKQRRLVSMAIDYLARRGLTDRPCRFDVIAIDDVDGASPVITVYCSAFDASR